MKTLNFNYNFQVYFKEPVNRHYFTLKCLPKSEARQQIKKLKVYINSDYNSLGQDCFGNKYIYGYKEQKHQLLEIKIEGSAQIDWQNYDNDRQLLTVYTLPSTYTKYDEQMLPLMEKVQKLFQPEDSTYQKALKIMDIIYEIMTYEKEVTNVHTTAKEAYLLKKGVCQDYSHLMIAILRYFKIPCRYVSGLLENESFTHAWVEVYCTNGWYAFDPTNHLLVDDRYLAFARGRDAKDTLVNKGVFFGLSKEQKQKIEIVVEE